MADPFREPVTSTSGDPADAKMWTARIRRRVLEAFPAERVLPDRQPAYVASWSYGFGVVTIAALVIVIASGCILALKGPTWWHVSVIGRFVNSCHLWSVELFFAAMVVHLWGKFFMAAWRGNRAMTWAIGVVTFVASILTAFTGYVSQTNFDAQWIAVNAKDAINSTGAGGFFNPLNFGQMYGIHVMLLPVVVSALVMLHLIQVRMKGVVKPLGAKTAPKTSN